MSLCCLLREATKVRVTPGMKSQSRLADICHRNYCWFVSHQRVVTPDVPSAFEDGGPEVVQGAPTGADVVPHHCSALEHGG